MWRVTLPDDPAAVAWSPDDRHLAVAGTGGPVLLLDAGTGAVAHALAGHATGATAVAWVDDWTLASAGQDGRVRVWDAATGGERLALDAGGRWVEKVTVSPGGAYITSAAGKRVLAWPATGGCCWTARTTPAPSPTSRSGPAGAS